MHTSDLEIEQTLRALLEGSLTRQQASDWATARLILEEGCVEWEGPSRFPGQGAMDVLKEACRSMEDEKGVGEPWMYRRQDLLAWHALLSGDHNKLPIGLVPELFVPEPGYGLPHPDCLKFLAALPVHPDTFEERTGIVLRRASVEGVGLLSMAELRAAGGAHVIATGVWQRESHGVVLERVDSLEDSLELLGGVLDLLGLTRDVCAFSPDENPRLVQSWTLLRQDDNGYVCSVRAFYTRVVAEWTAREFEARGHKQTYWVTGES